MIDNPKRLPTQIAQRVRDTKNGIFSDYFKNVYDMTSIAFSIGHTTIGGNCNGITSEKNGSLSFSGNIDFYLEDEFKDPTDIFDMFSGGDVELPRAKPYRIYDTWQGQVSGKVYTDASRSAYKT